MHIEPGRVLPFSKAENFRELGGWPAAGGKTVKHGLFFRCGALCELESEEDLEAFRALGIKVICDLRSTGERTAQPDPAFAGVLGGQKPILKVRSMTSCWGVCCPAKRQITFALQLYNQPPAAQIYVVVHEYCHFLQLNHSPAFWAEVEKLLPDWKVRRELLKR